MEDGQTDGLKSERQKDVKTRRSNRHTNEGKKGRISWHLTFYLSFDNSYHDEGIHTSLHSHTVTQSV